VTGRRVGGKVISNKKPKRAGGRGEATYDETIDQLIELAGIPPRIGLWWPEREMFASDLARALKTANTLWRMTRVSEIKGHIPIATAADKLIDALKKPRPELLSFVFSREDIQAVKKIRRGAQRMSRLAKLNPKKRAARWDGSIRDAFVRKLLSAAVRASGELKLNNSNKSLLLAVQKLKPYLPPAIVAHTSESTLRRVYDPWLKQRAAANKHTPRGLRSKTGKSVRKSPS
jgi:hypothetical protein